MSGTYLHWGVFNISATDLVIIGVMVVLFVLALLLPFPQHPEYEDHGEGAS